MPSYNNILLIHLFLTWDILEYVNNFKFKKKISVNGKDILHL